MVHDFWKWALAAQLLPLASIVLLLHRMHYQNELFNEIKYHISLFCRLSFILRYVNAVKWESLPVCSMALRVVTVLMIAAVSSDAADYSMMAESLKKLAHASRSNFNDIKSWTGLYTVQDRTRVDEDWFARTGIEPLPSGKSPWQKIDTGVMSFDLDNGQDGVRSRFFIEKSVIALDADLSSMNFLLPLSSSQVSIIAKGRYYFIEPGASYGDLKDVPAIKGISGRVAFRDEIRKAESSRYSTVVTPINLYSFNRPFWEELEALAALLETDSGIVDSVKKTFNIVSHTENGSRAETIQFRLLAPGSTDTNSGIRVQIVCLPDQGSNFSSVVVKGPDNKVKQSFSWQYRESDGIWVPSKYVHQNVDRDGISISFERILQLKKSDVNIPIDHSVFEVASGLELTEGERVVDGLEEVVYFVGKNGELLRQASFDEPASMIRKDHGMGGSSTLWQLLIYGNVVLFVTIACIAGWRWLCHSNAK